MRSFLLLATILPLSAQTALSPEQITRLTHACVPAADPVTVLAITQTESSRNPLALSLNYPQALARQMGLPPGRIYLKHQPRTQEEAVLWTEELRREGKTVSIGLLQVSVEQATLPVANVLEPCRNLQVGWGIFVEKYQQGVRKLGPGQTALRWALAAYNGFGDEYVPRILVNWISSRSLASAVDIPRP